jgi:hypothetical protein
MLSTKAMTDGAVRPVGAPGAPSTVHVETLPSPASFYGSGFTLPPAEAEFWEHCGFQRVLFLFEADAQKHVTSLNAVIDVFHTGDGGPFKVGRVSYWGKLSTAHDKPEWVVSMAHSCPYNERNAHELPPLVRKTGPGAFITAVIQTIFGTKYGQKLLGLENYTFPEGR